MKKTLLGLGVIAMALSIGLTLSTINRSDSYLSENLEVLTIEESANGLYCRLPEIFGSLFYTIICSTGDVNHCLCTSWCYISEDRRYPCQVF